MSEGQKREGFDAPVRARESDHLNRWPFAREIYTAAVSGPKDWSVRIGVYGEWGTGKTSVLEFISSMALEHEHVVVWFDPWEYSSTDDLWREFILNVFSVFEKSFGGIAAAGDARRKAWIEKVSGVVKSVGGAVAGLVNEKAGNVAEAGLGLLKKHFHFGPGDLESLNALLGDRRVIILIDDLDRTAAELVPEILFALKQLMDIPGFSYVTAFDPGVVGKVLGKDHPGFEDGLKFLEKIIDYPRWLPPPDSDGLAQLALRERQTYSPFVPEGALKDAVQLLPSNPRAIRQFIRLLSLLRPQIERHTSEELQWPVILAANVIKVRYPKLAHPLLRDEDFWRKWRQATFGMKNERDDSERAKLLNSHVDEVVKKEMVELTTKERDELICSLQKLCTSGGAGILVYEDNFTYQLEIAEAPAAVTWKEFDQFLSIWETSRTKDSVTSWISEHVKLVERSEERVHRELARGAIKRYADVLHRADTVLLEQGKQNYVAAADALIALIELLLLELSGIGTTQKRIGENELEALFETFARLANALSSAHKSFHDRNEKLLVEVLAGWAGDCEILMEVLKPHFPHSVGHFEFGRARELFERLCALLWPKYARQLLDSFRIHGSMDRITSEEKGTFAARSVILNSNGPLWKGLRTDAFSLLAEATHNSIIQENAFALLSSFDELLRNHPGPGIPVGVSLLIDTDVARALWDAATVTPLTPYGVVRLCAVAKFMRQHASVTMPHWWDATLKLSGYNPDAQQQSDSNEGPDTNQAAPDGNAAPVSTSEELAENNTLSKQPNAHSPEAPEDGRV